MTLLEISGLTLDLRDGTRLLDGVTLTVAEGETVGLVGESGSGKSLTAGAALGVMPAQSIASGSIRLDGAEVRGASARELRRMRREVAAMIFQDPRASINPIRTIGDHMTEAMIRCEGRSRSDARRRALELLAAVGLPRPVEHLRQYPHELSGGMLQRVMIASALASTPRLLICDEPTTALDVTTQAEIVSVLSEQRASRGMGMLFITHDLNLAAAMCDRVYVMSAGRIEEEGEARQVFLSPRAAYTKRLVAATPTIGGQGDGADHTTPARPAKASPMLQVTELSKSYRRRGSEPVVAVNDCSLTIGSGDALGVVGESGSGKSTLARMIVGLESADSGTIVVGGRRRAARRTREERLAHARSVQMVFQDPYLSLDPRICVGRAIEDALRLHVPLTSTDARRRVLTLLEQVGLTESHANARPRHLSGGQRQRVAIARALAIESGLLVMDEATSALDVSVQAQVLELVADIRRERNLTLLFISHDLAVVRRVCDDVVVMRHGSIVERGPTTELLRTPQHPYTRLLIDSVPRPDWERDPTPAKEGRRESASRTAVAHH